MEQDSIIFHISFIIFNLCHNFVFPKKSQYLFSKKSEENPLSPCKRYAFENNVRSVHSMKEFSFFCTNELTCEVFVFLRLYNFSDFYAVDPLASCKDNSECAKDRRIWLYPSIHHTKHLSNRSQLRIERKRNVKGAKTYDYHFEKNSPGRSRQ